MPRDNHMAELVNYIADVGFAGRWPDGDAEVLARLTMEGLAVLRSLDIDVAEWMLHELAAAISVRQERQRLITEE